MKNVYITLWQIYSKHMCTKFIQNWPSCAEDMAKHFGLLFSGTNCRLPHSFTFHHSSKSLQRIAKIILVVEYKLLLLRSQVVLCKIVGTLSVILINKANVIMTNKLSRVPTTPMMLLMTLSEYSRPLFSIRSSFFDEGVVKLFPTSLGNDAFSIVATNYLRRLPQQSVPAEATISQALAAAEWMDEKPNCHAHPSGLFI